MSNPIFRTYGRMCPRQSAVIARIIAARPYLAQKAHINHVLHLHTVCCQTVRDRSRRDYTKPIFIYAIHTRVENPPAGKKRDHPSERITIRGYRGSQ